MSRNVFIGILLAIVWTATPPRATHATTIAVTTTDDELNSDGDCSLREAVRAANLNVAVDACPAGQNDQTDTITVPAGTYTLMIPGDDDDASAGDLDLLNNAADLDLVITGAGAATTIIQACAVDQRTTPCPAGQGLFDRVLQVRAHVQISGVTVRHGRAPRVNIRRGSGIYVDGISNPADLTLTDVVVTENGLFNPDVDTQGGGISNEYGGKLTLVRTTVSDNAASGTSDYAGGGGIFNGASDSSVLVMTDSTVSGNTAGPGVTTGGGIWNSLGGQATLTGCTISNNVGGGIGNSGHLVPSTMTLTNCTISGNQATGSGAGITNGATLNLRSSTVTLNHRLLGPGADGAGGIYGTGPTVLRNTIVAGNIHDDPSPSSHSPDCDDSGLTNVISEGFSLVGDGKHCPGLVDGVNGDQIGTTGAEIDAKLGPLADNGGPTLTHALLEGSLAIDGGDPATPGSGGTACPATDQRGESRPDGPACDVGSFEGGSTGGGAIAVDSVKPTRGGNTGTVQTHLYGRGFVVGATVKLVRPGSADVVGSGSDVGASTITTSFDLRGVAAGVWSVVVTNPDASTATLADAFTVEAGGGADLWSELILPRVFTAGRYNSIYVVVGNRGTVDAYGVPVWLSIPEELEYHIPFRVSAPPSQPGQVPMDWTRIAIDTPIPLPEYRDSFSLLLPVVPAGSTTTLKFRVKNPPPPENCSGDDCVDPSHLPFKVSEDIGPAYFEPNLSPAVLAAYVEQAKEYAAEVVTPGVPSDAAIKAYIRTQLAAVVANGIADANVSGYPPVYSQAQLIIDTGNFIAAANQTSSLDPASRFASVVGNFVGACMGDLVSRPAEARITNPECDPGDFTCEHDDAPKPCPIPELCCPIPGVLCNKNPGPIKCDQLNQIGLEWVYVPCKPKNNGDRPFDFSFDPNDKFGPGDPDGFIDGVAPLPYTVVFENLPTASGDAYEVTITDQLDVTKYDLDTFSLGSISFADKFVPVPPGLKTYVTEVDLRPGANILVGIDAALDTGTGIVTWKFTTLDPATHQFPEDAVEGFLPPNVTPPEGEGAVLFTVNLKPGFGLGTTVCNKARVVFDFNAPIDTPNFCNTIGAPEDCENCIDDDGDGKIDAEDPDCAAPANGGGVGVGGAAGKAVDKCAKAIRKAGDKITSTRLKQLGACQKAVADCVQLKPGDAACLAKATAKCTKARGGLPAAEAKLTAAITKACSDPTVATADLLAATGLGFDGEAEACGRRGLAGVATIADVAECVRRQHVCAADRVLGAAVPRARELLVLGGFDPVADLGCVPNGANGGEAAIAPEKRKALRKCDAALQKAAGKLLAGRAKAVQACGAAVFTCVQTKPNDESCVKKAGSACAKTVGALPKLTAGFTATIAKACGAPLTPDDLLGAAGLGASALGEPCAKLGVASLATVADVSTCVERQIACDARQQIENATPRLKELLDLGGVALP